MARIRKSLGVSARSTRHFLGKRLGKVSFSVQNKGASAKNRIFIAMAVVGLLLFGSGLFLSFFTYLRSSFLDYSVPFLRVVQGGREAMDRLSIYLEEALELARDPRHFGDVKRQKDLWEIRAKGLEDENKRLIKMLDLKNRLIHQGYGKKILSRVIARTPSQYGRLVVIAGGRQARIFPKDIVVDERGLVGQIFDSGNKVSRVLLLTDPRSRIPVRLEPSGHQAIMYGDYTDFPSLSRMKMSLSLGEVMTNERVYTSGSGGGFYAHIPIGVVFKDAQGGLRVKPYMDVRELDGVGILESLSLPPENHRTLSHGEETSQGKGEV